MNLGTNFFIGCCSFIVRGLCLISANSDPENKAFYVPTDIAHQILQVQLQSGSRASQNEVGASW